MNSFFTKILRKRGFVPKGEALNMGLRLFKAGQTSRLTNDFLTSQSSIDADIRAGGDAVRARAQDLARNNPYIKGYLLDSRVNIVGPVGFAFQNRAKKYNPETKQMELNEFANDIIERGFKRWQKKENCTMQQRYSFLQVCHLALLQWKRDGEILFRTIYGPTAQNEFGFSLDLLEASDIDEHYNQELSNGNVVKLGIEYDSWRRVAAVWIRKKTTRDELTFVDRSYYTEHYRVPADEIIFAFDPDHPKQTRGVSPMVQAMLTVDQLDGWEEASIVNARAAAETMGFILKKRLENDEFTGDEIDSSDSSAALMNSEAGQIIKLGFGEEFSGWDPKFPHEQDEPFTRRTLRKISKALGVDYSRFSNDRTNENYSSLRQGALNERDLYTMDQELFKHMFLLPVFERWLKWSLLSMALRPLTLDEYNILNQPEFKGRRWQWVDPLKEVTAAKVAEEQGYVSRRMNIETMGNDKESVDDDIRKDLPIKKELGIPHGGMTQVELNVMQDSDANNGDEENLNGNNGRGHHKTNGNGKGNKEFYQMMQRF